MNILKDFISLVINSLNTKIQNLIAEISTDYQKKLVAGDNITIDPDTNEISASGGGGGLNQYIMFFEGDSNALTKCSFVFCSKYDIGDNPDIFNGSTKKDWSDFMKKYFSDFPNYNLTPSATLARDIGIFGNCFENGVHSALLWFAPVQSGLSSLPRIGVAVYGETSNPGYAFYNLETYIDFDDATPIDVITIIQKLQ